MMRLNALIGNERIGLMKFFLALLKKALPTDGPMQWTDQRIDRQTDTSSYRDARRHLKKCMLYHIHYKRTMT